MPSKTHAEKVLHVTFGIHKTTIFCPLEQAEPLAEIPWRRSCETLEQQQDSGTCQAKRTPKKCFTSPLESIKQQNNNLLSSRASKTISRNPLEAQLRNTRTAAGFGHMPSKTHAEKVLHVTFGIHKTTIFCPLEQAEPLAEIPWRRSCETLEQQQDSGKNNNLLSSRASKTHAEKVLHVTFGIHKTTIFCPLEQAKPLPWRRSCETLEQQQDSGTCQAKRTPKKCFTSPLESISANGSACSRGQKIVVLWIPKVT